MLFYLLCDRCRAPSTRIVNFGWPGEEAVYCEACYAAALPTLADGAASDTLPQDTRPRRVSRAPESASVGLPRYAPGGAYRCWRCFWATVMHP